MTSTPFHLKPPDAVRRRSGRSGQSTPASVDSVEEMIRLEPSIHDEHVGVEDVTPRTRNEPLPDEKYPRVIDKRQPEQGYYIAMGVIMSVWIITPLSW